MDSFMSRLRIDVETSLLRCYKIGVLVSRVNKVVEGECVFITFCLIHIRKGCVCHWLSNYNRDLLNLCILITICHLLSRALFNNRNCKFELSRDFSVPIIYLTIDYYLVVSSILFIICLNEEHSGEWKESDRLIIELRINN